MPKVTINLSQGLIEVEGSEEFVTNQIEMFQKSMLPAATSIANKIAQLNPSAVARDAGFEIPGKIADLKTNPLQVKQNKYDNVFSIDSTGQIHLLRTCVGTDAEKTRCVALLYLYAKKILNGENSASGREIRMQCKKHGCLDASNFSRIVDHLKTMIMPIGKVNSKNKSYELTIPGENEAEKLAGELSNNVKNNT